MPLANRSLPPRIIYDQPWQSPLRLQVRSSPGPIPILPASSPALRPSPLRLQPVACTDCLLIIPDDGSAASRLSNGVLTSAQLSSTANASSLLSALPADVAAALLQVSCPPFPRPHI